VTQRHRTLRVFCALAIPAVPRFYAFALALCFSFSATAQEQPLTEREVVQRALARAPLQEVFAGRIAVEQGRSIAARAYPNPQIVYLREQTYGVQGTGEDYVSAAQIVDLGRRRALNGRAGEARSRAAEQDAENGRCEVAAETRLRFFALLHRQRRELAVAEWIGRIDEALTIVRRREERGDAALYDRRRLERERSLAIAKLEMERAQLERAQGHLAALIASPGGAPLASGDLLPEAEPAQLSELRGLGARRPDLLALDRRLEASALEIKSARRFWLPDLRLEGGWKGVGYRTGGVRSDGFLVGGALTFPLWDRMQGPKRIAEGEARESRGRRLLLTLEMDAELAGARAETVRLRAAALMFRAQSGGMSADLARIAAAGYGGGELGLLELLDAYRGAAEDALTALDLELAAREARIEVDRLTGAAFP
jgi:cobalt-zinc-cadmium efflux system outer membrane protein